MNDDYLWDRSGKPDPQIEQLEEVLGTLGHQPHPLEIPARLQPGDKRFFFPGFAIAATLLLILVGAGLWWGWQKSSGTQVTKTEANSPVSNKSNHAAVVPTNPNLDQRSVVGSAALDQKREAISPRQGVKTSAFAANTNQSRSVAPKAPAVALNEEQAAEAAKEKLMLALRVASVKLNYVQRKMQGTNSATPIQNQHRTG